MIARGQPRYAEFLSASAAALWPLEQALGTANVARILPDWHERARSAALRADLADLGISAPPTTPAPEIKDDAFLFGVLYVLEGSRLGARLLTRRVLATGTPSMHRATRYLRHGEGKPLWQTFLCRLEASAAVRRAPKCAVAGAIAAFACFTERSASPIVPNSRTADAR